MGKSIFGGGESAAYRLNRRAYLPKFNEGKNPFAPKTPDAAPEPAKEKAAAPVQKSPPPYAFKPVHIPQGLVASAPQPVKPAKTARQGWTTRLNPFRAAPEEPKESPAATQPELSLNAVKVVHNDLADADVEVVPVKSHTDTVAAAPVLPPARRAWEYMGENMLKS